MTSTPTRPVDNVVITTKGLQDRNINILDGTSVENKDKLILALYTSIYVSECCTIKTNTKLKIEATEKKSMGINLVYSWADYKTK